MNSNQYHRVIDESLLPQAKEWFPADTKWVYQQDNAPSHKSHMIMQHLNNRGFQLLDWAPNSPDISPIETAWSLLKKEIRKRNVSKEELWQACENVWYNSQTIKDFCATIPASMCRRVQSLLSVKGAQTKY